MKDFFDVETSVVSKNFGISRKIEKAMQKKINESKKQEELYYKKKFEKEYKKTHIRKSKVIEIINNHYFGACNVESDKEVLIKLIQEMNNVRRTRKN